MVTRRDFLKATGGVVAGAVVGTGCDSSNDDFVVVNPPNGPNGRPPNILLVLVDEMRQPPLAYAPNEGELQDIKEILRFESELSPTNRFTQLYSGFMRFRKNSVVLRNHYTAAAACAPSRTTFLTGQYPSLHGVTQVNGTFKVPDDIYFLDPNGVPTVGDWFRAGGYETHYFGKWHVSNTSEPPYDLEPWGFSSYESSGPDPDSSIPGLGVYRDPGFTDIVSGFFAQKANDTSGKPWFAVASFANPHDTGAYPAPFYLPATQGVTGPLTGPDTPQPIPAPGTLTNTDADRPLVQLNPDGFPENTFELPQTWSEDLSAKPDCHLDSAWKMQMALAGAFAQFQTLLTPYPTQRLSTQLQIGWAKATGNFYLYLQYLVNIEIDLTMQAFDAAGLAENTIVIFTSDHGSNVMAHNQMIQKFFTAYEESTRVPFIISSPLINSSDTVRQVDLVTSHIDLAPTLLGLAGFSDAQIQQLKAGIAGQTQVRDFVGLNLAPYLTGNAPLPRPGVLFTTSDDATLPAFPVTPENQTNHDNYQIFLQRVDALRADPANPAPLFPGACVEPNAVHMFSTGDWKYCRYWDDQGNEPDQYEMYHLGSDRRETNNLVDFRTGALRPGAQVPGFSQAQLQAQLDLLRAQLAEQEAQLLLTPT